VELIRGVPDPIWVNQDEFIRSITTILTQIKTSEKTLDDITNQVIKTVKHRKMGYENWKNRVKFHILTSGLAEVDDKGYLHLTDNGNLFLKTKSMRIILNSLEENVLGIKEIESIIHDKPRTTKEIMRELRKRGINWKTPTQIRTRIAHLILLGAVKRVMENIVG